jgi:hypothetical protein
MQKLDGEAGSKLLSDVTAQFEGQFIKQYDGAGRQRLAAALLAKLSSMIGKERAKLGQGNSANPTAGKRLDGEQSPANLTDGKLSGKGLGQNRPREGVSKGDFSSVGNFSRVDGRAGRRLLRFIDGLLSGGGILEKRRGNGPGRDQSSGADPGNPRLSSQASARKDVAALVKLLAQQPPTSEKSILLQSTFKSCEKILGNLVNATLARMGKAFTSAVSAKFAKQFQKIKHEIATRLQREVVSQLMRRNTLGHNVQSVVTEFEENVAKFLKASVQNFDSHAVALNDRIIHALHEKLRIEINPNMQNFAEQTHYDRRKKLQDLILKSIRGEVVEQLNRCDYKQSMDKRSQADNLAEWHVRGILHPCSNRGQPCSKHATKKSQPPDKNFGIEFLYHLKEVQASGRAMSFFLPDGDFFAPADFVENLKLYTVCHCHTAKAKKSWKRFSNARIQKLRTGFEDGNSAYSPNTHTFWEICYLLNNENEPRFSMRTSHEFEKRFREYADIDTIQQFQKRTVPPWPSEKFDQIISPGQNE